jgi:hypothetical protein
VGHYDPFKVIAAIPRERKLADVMRGYRCQGGEIGRRARLRIPKSSISKHRLPFQIKRVLQEENGIFRDVVAIRE